MLKVRWKTITRSNVRSVKSSTPMHSFIGISEAIKWGRCEIDELTSIILKRCCCTSHGSIGVSCESLKTVRASTSSYRSVRKGVEKSAAWSETVCPWDLSPNVCHTCTNSKNTKTDSSIHLKTSRYSQTMRTLDLLARSWFRKERQRYVRESKHTHTPYQLKTSLQFIDLIRKIDSVLIDFRATPYYESPQPHVSVAWHSGPCPSTIKTGHTKFTTKETDSFQALEVVCKIGNKSHIFPLVLP